MAETIHGHEVLGILIEAKGGFTREDLANVVAERFGEVARFHTCSDEGLSLEQILGMFLSKGRVEDIGGHLRVTGEAKMKLSRNEC